MEKILQKAGFLDKRNAMALIGDYRELLERYETLKDITDLSNRIEASPDLPLVLEYRRLLAENERMTDYYLAHEAILPDGELGLAPEAPAKRGRKKKNEMV